MRRKAYDLWPERRVGLDALQEVAQQMARDRGRAAIAASIDHAPAADRVANHRGSALECDWVDGCPGLGHRLAVSSKKGAGASIDLGGKIAIAFDALVDSLAKALSLLPLRFSLFPEPSVPNQTLHVTCPEYPPNLGRVPPPELTNGENQPADPRRVGEVNAGAQGTASTKRRALCAAAPATFSSGKLDNARGHRVGAHD